MPSKRTRAAVGVAILGLLGGLLTATPAAAAETRQPTSEYSNPITSDFADSYADPSIIRGRDGWWYLYATSDPLVEGGEFGIMHTARSRDLVDWEYLGPVWDETTVPDWAATGSFFWAPDVRRIGETYLMYFTVTDTAANPGADNAIGVATAPSAAGPWTPTDGPVVAPSLLPGTDPADLAWRGTIDPALLATTDGRLLLYYGGFAGGVSVVELDPTGTATVGEATRVAMSDRYEGSYVVEHDGWYVLMLSSAGCCAGPTAGYSVFAGRSQSPTGPFVDAEGVRLDATRPGGTQVLAQTGDRWVGVGHHAVVTDVAGQDWIVYHAIDRGDPWLNEPGGINRRPTLIDRLDWVDGWPVVNGGAGPGEGPMPAPVATGELGIRAAAPAATRALRPVTGRWTATEDTSADGGEIAVLTPGRRVPGVATAATAVRGAQRVEADVRLPDGGAGCVRIDGLRAGVSVCVDARTDRLRLSTRSGATRQTADASVPTRVSTTGWLSLSIELADGRLTAQLGESRLGDPVASATLPHEPGAQRSLVSLAASGGRLEVDNLTVAPVTRASVTPIADPRAGPPILEDDFDGPALDPAWQLVRGRDDIRVDAGALAWPLGADDLAGEDGAGPLLLRDAPDGDWIAETRLALDLGEGGPGGVRNFQQAGLVLHAGDDEFLRLGSVALGESRVVEYLAELPGDGRIDRGSWIGGPTAVELSLRILHTTAPDGTERYRAASSVDGEHWRWGAVWTLPAGTEARIGLYAGGGAVPAATARFDDFRLLTVG